MELRKFMAPEFIFGLDARRNVVRYMRLYGTKKPLLVTDQGVWDAGWAQEIVDVLEAQGFEVLVTKAVSPNPRDREVMAGADLFNAEKCDILVAVGGGSVMDAAKGIGIVVSNHHSILDYEGVDRIPKPMPPLVCIPTTAGTAADVSQFAIINNTVERVKIAIISKAVVPDVALIDPVPLTSMDPYLTACTGMDALVHAVEAFVSNASSPITDLHALEAIRLVKTHLLACVLNPQDLQQRAGMMMASLQAGLAFSNASLGAVHAMAHSLGGWSDLPHGECNALLLPHVVDYNFSAAESRYLRISEALGFSSPGSGTGNGRSSLLKGLERFREDVGIKPGLALRGIKDTDIPILARKAIQDPCNATNPRDPQEQDLITLFREAL